MSKQIQNKRSQDPKSTPRRTWQKTVFAIVAVVLILSWILTLFIK
jgi:hypothetical protein